MALSNDKVSGNTKFEGTSTGEFEESDTEEFEESSIKEYKACKLVISYLIIE
ncbi:hypothetical protein RhiirA4_478964 [Rhizophagus irregularis]|uniref:Uncharacterized protein n=1 Tax=Rhizophagus irregularis TaxID=588596 RepID=A0A2I1HFR3_9GLOM|nr:hypothetical protein RhiirA4_478964 [Rhizophagus irregularis]